MNGQDQLQRDRKRFDQLQRDIKWFSYVVDGDLLAINEMLREGFDINTKHHVNEANALHYVSLRKDQEKIYRTVQLLIKNNVNIEALDYLDNTPLTQPRMMRNAPRVITYLIDSGANIHHKNIQGKTALMNAIEFENEAIVNLLLSKGANINETDRSGDTIARIVKKEAEKGKNKLKSFKILYNHIDKLNEEQREIIEKEKMRLLFVK